MQRRFDRQWTRNAAKGKAHARLIERKPELREQLYGGRPPDRQTGTRETAHRRDDDNG